MTMKLTTRLKSGAALALGCATLASAATPRTLPGQDDGEGPRPAINNPWAEGSASSPEKEMVRLFQRVESGLSRMGSYLLDAGAGDTSKLKEMDESGILDLLREADPKGGGSGGIGDLLAVSHAEGEQVLEDIDRILELAAQNGGT